MDVPPEIAFRHVEPTDALKRIIHEGIDSLEKVHPKQRHMVNREDPITLPAATYRPWFVAHSTWLDGSSANRTSRWLMGSDKVTAHQTKDGGGRSVLRPPPSFCAPDSVSC